MTINFPTQYETQTIEKKWQDHWQKSGLYKWDPNIEKKDSFIIDTPPPTVSGSLHMGHVFSYTQTDFIARFQRMKGKNVFYPMGFDDNGLPTERLVEKTKNIRGVNMAREEFQKICHEVVNEAEIEFYNLFNSIALSVDWSQKYQTISANTSTISQLSFLDMYEKNEIYRKMQPCLWDPVDQTALAQADIVDQEIPGKMYDVKFYSTDEQELIISTTRPELLGACVALLYHKDDARYTNLAEKFAITPIFGAKVPIIADDNVDPEKGTGLVMCCTFGDITDIEWWRKHNLPLRVILDKTGRICLSDKLNNQDFNYTPSDLLTQSITALEGLKVKAAHEKTIQILEAQQRVTNSKEVIKNVKCAERSGAPLEILVTPQWFIKILDKKEQLLEKSKQINWHPAYMKIRLDNWINGLNWDWCISRQRFFGVPIPAWYSKRKGEEGKIILPRAEDLPVDPLKNLPHGYNRDEIEADPDVMDTWATSSVSPQTNSQAINEKYAVDMERHHKLFPADLRPQAHEIIRTWTFYTMVKALIHQDTIPWKNIMLSGWCLAADKTKMSKSKGNVVTPQHLIIEKGTDIVRYWASASKLGADIAYSEELFKIGKKLVNKLWNAAKFVTGHIENLPEIEASSPEQLHLKLDQITHQLDRWILTKLSIVIEQTTKEFSEFEYCNARSIIEEFFWKDFCDNYLELVKVRAYNQEQKDQAGQNSAQYALAIILNNLLRLFAPFLPHLCEELYSLIFKNMGSVHAKNCWPTNSLLTIDIHSRDAGQNIVEILDVVRKVKADKKLSLKAEIEQITLRGALENIAQNALQDLQNVTNAKKIEISHDSDYDLKYKTSDEKFALNIKFSNDND